MAEQKTGADQLKRTLSRRLLEAEETLKAICAGEVDAVVVDGAAGQQVYTLESPDQPFRIFVEKMQEGALTLNRDGTIVYCNRFFADLVRCPLEQTRGQRLQDFLDDDARAGFEDLLKDAARGPAHHEFLLRTTQGEPRPIQLALNPLPDVQRSMFGAVITDLTDRERARDLEAKRQAAEDANTARDQFLAVVSHELRTPLNAILGWAQLLLRRSEDLSPQVQRGLEVVERSAWAQAQLIDDLLDVSRVLAGKLRLSWQRINVNEVVEAAAASIQPSADAKRISLEIVTPEKGAEVEGDPDRLQQVVWNLLSNAVKFTGDGGKVWVAVRTVAEYVEVSVRDTGVGIDPTYLPQLFELYRQIEGSTTRRTGGLGLGLAIVKQLTELHGGTVAADSPGKDQGATFTARLPLATDAAVTQPPPVAAADSTSSSLHGIHVLVVEDETASREMLSEILMFAGAVVTVAESAAEGLEKLERGDRIDVLVSDIGLPETDWYAFIRRVRSSGRSGRELPAVALTAFAGRSDQRHALVAGYQVHMSKPVDQDELIAVIANLGRHLVDSPSGT